MTDTDLLLAGRDHFLAWADEVKADAAALDAYVTALVAGESPSPPPTTTELGKGLVAWAQMGRAESAPGVARWPFRGIYCRDEDFAACYAALPLMGLNAMECATFAGSSDTQLVRRLDSLLSDLGWILFGSGFNPSSSGGSFGIGDGKLDALMTAVGTDGFTVPEHPQNSHRYEIADEINLTGYSGSALQANLDTIKRRVDRVKSHDPLAVVSVTEYRQAQLDPEATPGAIWKGVVDEVKLDGYPNWTPYQEDTIPNQAAWCEAAGVPYSFCVSCHDYNGKPGYPTEERFDHMADQAAATKARDFYLYIWNDGTQPSLSDDPEMQRHIGTKMAPVAS